jgi:hypothetical protein
MVIHLSLLDPVLTQLFISPRRTTTDEPPRHIDRVAAIENPQGMDKRLYRLITEQRI